MLKIDKITTEKKSFLIEFFLDSKEDEELLIEVLHMKILYEFFHKVAFSFFIEDLKDFIAKEMNIVFKYGDIKNYISVGLNTEEELCFIFKHDKK